MEGNSRYTFEFPMPASEDLRVMVTGHEQDVLNNPDSLGDIRGTYGRDTNWGARTDVYSGAYGRETPCDDTFCTPCPEGLYAQWRITRVH